jgi:transcriptional regulator of acetoin/glycerol metabolism
VLLLDEPSRSLTERFHEGQVPSPEQQQHPVLARWARAARLGIVPDQAAFPAVTSGAELVARQDRLEDTLRDENLLLDQVAGELASRDVVTLLADPDGVVLASRGGGGFHDAATRVRLVEGALWSESARGTNAIGTAAAEGKAVAVVGRAHYETRIADLFCYATPVRDAYGDLVAVLDVTGRMDRHDPTLALAVQTAGVALEHALRARAFGRLRGGGLPVLERLVGRHRSPALIVEASGHVRCANDAARALLQAGVARGPRLAARTLETGGTLTSERIFGVTFRQLATLGLAGRGNPQLDVAGTTFSVDVDPLLGDDGRTLALVVCLEPVARRTRSPGPGAPGASHPAFASLLGTDPAFLRATALAQRFAATPLSVLLLAETGTGKELFARAIHAASARAQGPFVALNCGAISESLLESELFGHAPGAFTGASRTGSEGKIGAANGGTLFLDEIADMPPAVQTALLRVLEDGTYHRVGDVAPRRSAFRLVCATCRELPALVDQGKFRSDLFYRINGACVTIPPLRERSDRVVLARLLLAQLQPNPGEVELNGDAVLWIEQHGWPGNVRELRSALQHALVLADGGPIAREHFPEVLLSGIGGDGAGAHLRSAPGLRTKGELLHDEYEATIRACDGNVAEAARRLGVARSTLYRALKR